MNTILKCFFLPFFESYQRSIWSPWKLEKTDKIRMKKKEWVGEKEGETDKEM